jgi:hypothetical protein
MSRPGPSTLRCHFLKGIGMKFFTAGAAQLFACHCFMKTVVDNENVQLLNEKPVGSGITGC